MTAGCPGGGPSRPKAWVPALFLVPAGAAANYVGNAGGVWASVLAAAIGVKTYNATNNCATDPPGWPAALTFQEAFDVETFNIGSADFQSAIAKVNQLVDNVLWYVLCECVTAPTPAQPTFPSPPVGWTDVGSGTGQTPTYRRCVTFNTPQLDGAGHFETGAGAIDLASALLPSVGAQHLHMTNNQINTAVYDAPNPTPTAGRWVIDCTDTSVIQEIGLWMWNGATGQFQASMISFDSPPGTLHADTGIIPLPAFTQWGVTAGQANGDPTPRAMTACLELYGNAGTAGGGCCPPDQLTTTLLRQILSLVTPLQRYKAPFAFVTGAAHSGLSGTGSIAIPQCIGVDVNVTAGTAGHSVSGGNPSYIFDLGWVSISETGGMIQERRLSQQHFAWFPDHMQIADHFNYFLQPGVTITMTELYAET